MEESSSIITSDSDRLERFQRFTWSLLKADRLIMEMPDPQTLFEELGLIMMESAKATAVWIGLVDEPTGWFDWKVMTGVPESLKPVFHISVDASLPEGVGITSEAARQGRLVVWNDYLSRIRHEEWRKILTDCGFLSVVAVPFRGLSGRGVFALSGGMTNFFDPEICSVIEKFGDNISFALKTWSLDQERKDSERRLYRVTALYSAQAAVNRLVFRMPGEEELFSETLRILLDHSFFSSAGFYLPDSQNRFLELRFYKATSSMDLLERHPLFRSMSLDPNSLDARTAAVRTLRSGTPIIENDLVNAYRREGLLSRANDYEALAFRSAGLFPILRSGQSNGVFTVTSQEIGFFAPDIFNLLSEISKILSMALDAIDSEKKRLELEERMSVLIENLPEAIYFKDGEGRWKVSNQIGLRVFELEGTIDWMDKTDQELARIHPERASDYERFILSDNLAWSGGKTLTGIETHLDSDGHPICFETKKIPLFNPDGSRRGLVISAQDITERKKSEEAIKKSGRTIFTLKNYYRALSEINEFISLIPPPEELFRKACSILHRCEETSIVGIGELNIDADIVEWKTFIGPESDWMGDLKVSITPKSGQSTLTMAERIFKEGKPLISNDCAKDFSEKDLKNLPGFGISSMAMCPIFRKNSVIGNLTVVSRETGFFNEELAGLMNGVSRSLSFSIDNWDREQERKFQEERAQFLSLHDTLTELPNRRVFLDRIGQTILRSRRTGERFAVGILDLDGFKGVNDRLGHPAGDELLIQAGKRMAGLLRKTDTLARLGGDEFGLLLPNIEEWSASDNLFTKIVESLIDPFDLNYGFGEPVRISGSLGIAFCPPDPGDVDSLIARADLALYQVKNRGRNGWELFESGMQDSLLEQQRIMTDFGRALENGELFLCYQPQVDMETGQVVGAEALVRWNHPERGLLTPDSFIGAVEKSELILFLGRWVLETVMVHQKDWAREGLNLRVSVNIGARHFLSDGFIGDLKRVLSSNDRSEHPMIEIEITETEAFRDLSKTEGRVGLCRAMGVPVSLDDFGTGQASLTSLRQLDVRELKIDIGFVRMMMNSPKDQAIVSSLFAAARMLLIDVVAEGVESEDLGALLIRMGCRVAQGYAIARPMPHSMIPEWTREWRPFESWVQPSPEKQGAIKQ
ncbi:MAG: bifunctional diguanylate cyclase/phosphodiesterase [Leptospirales bacterium]